MQFKKNGALADGKLGMGELDWGCPVCSWGCHQRAGGCLPAELLKPGGCGAAEEGASCRRQNGEECAEPQPYRGKEVGVLHVGQGQGRGGLCCTWYRGLCFASWATRVLWTEGLLARYTEMTVTESWSNFCSILVQERGSCLTIQSWGAQHLLFWKLHSFC